MLWETQQLLSKPFCSFWGPFTKFGPWVQFSYRAHFPSFQRLKRDGALGPLPGLPTWLAQRESVRAAELAASVGSRSGGVQAEVQRGGATSVLFALPKGGLL